MLLLALISLVRLYTSAPCFLQAVHQAPAVLGLALIAMAEPLGAQMATRMLEHLLAYGEPPVRRCVPLALALLHVSDPAQQVVDALSRLSHDADTEVRARFNGCRV
jgi:26S proteasome regulatory subunit N1